MPVNISKSRQPRFWNRWGIAGAVTFAFPTFGANDLVIDAIATHLGGVAAGHQTLSLGRRLVNSGPDWSCWEPLCAVVVPTNEKRYQLGKVLPKIPPCAVPVDIFFSSRNN